MRQSILVLTFIFLFCSSLFAQIFRFGVPNMEGYDMQRFHFGFSLGLDCLDVNLKTQTDYANLVTTSENELMEVSSTVNLAFNVGIVANMRLGKYFDLRFIPNYSIPHDILLHYRFKYPVPYPDQDPNKPTVPDSENVTRTINCHYINFPLMVKFKSSRMHNVRIYALAGGQLGLNITSARNTKIKDKNHKVQADVIPIIKPYDVQVKGGFGFDFYTTYFKFTTEFKVSFGVINLLETEENIKDKAYIEYYKKSPIITGLKSLKSKTFTISFIIE